MTIETKYDIGDLVYMVIDNGLYKKKISEIKVSVHGSYTTIVYGWVGATTYYVHENQCWPSPEDFVANSKA